jgi:ABC-type dipeptide/oligopeptide/nickel transport system permease component
LRIDIVTFLIRRLVSALILILALITVDFFIIHVAPGNPVLFLAGDQAPPAYQQQIYQQLGLGQPLYVQFVTYLGRVLHGNLGQSLIYNQPVLTLVLSRMQNTLLLLVFQLAISFVLGTLLGTFLAMQSSRKTEGAVRVAALLGYSIPSFWLAEVFALVFGVYLRILPLIGMTSGIGETGFDYVADVLYHLILPGLSLAIGNLVIYMRFTRSGIINELHKDYITTARAKGLEERTVVLRHALRNSILPLITALGLQISYVLTSTVLVETIFGWPGIGSLLLMAFNTRDYPLISGIFIIAGTFVILVNFGIDVLYGFLDPRVKLK